MPTNRRQTTARHRLVALTALAFAAALPAQTAETVLYNFPALPNGSEPYGALIIDPSGNLFGTALQGGLYNAGVIYKVNTAGNETVLYNFTGGADGGSPLAGLVRDSAGNLYGAAEGGGSRKYGTVYKLDPSGALTVLHSFADGKDGKFPAASVLLDGRGNLYGTTQRGGASGQGVVYKLDNTGHETLVHTFTGGADGSQPYASLTLDAAGNLYGTAAYGGYTGGECRGGRSTPAGCGVVYKIDPSGNYSVVYRFLAGKDAAVPLS